MWLYSYAVSAGRRWTGENYFSCFYVIHVSDKSTGEQLLLLAKGGGGGDGVWEAKGETGASQ